MSSIIDIKILEFKNLYDIFKQIKTQLSTNHRKSEKFNVVTRGNLRTQKNQEKIQTQVSKKSKEDRKIDEL